MGAAMMALPGLPLFAGPFDENDYLKYIPADKKLDPKWVASLYSRGVKEIYSQPKALNHIGMPVGGLFAGTVYLSGDGRLWLWDIFNRDQEGIQPREVNYNGQQVNTRSGANFIDPAKPVSPFKQGFEINVDGDIRTMDSNGFSYITFDGRYPMARITFSDVACPVNVVLECFSPFIPLNVNDSSIPVTIMSYTIRNNSKKPVKVVISGYTQNPVCIDTGANRPGRRVNRIVKRKKFTAIECLAQFPPKSTDVMREDIPFDDFERTAYGNWIAEGEAFGAGPVKKSDIPDYQGEVGGHGDRVVNSHASANGDDVVQKDSRTGTLTSSTFKIRRRYIAFDIGGGSHKGKTCLNLLVDGLTVASVTGNDNNRMERTAIPVTAWEGKEAQIQLVDLESGAWGNVGVDHIVFTDKAPETTPLGERRDFGTFSLALLNPVDHKATANEAKIPSEEAVAENLSGPLVGRISQIMTLEPAQVRGVTFAFGWHFPNFYDRDFKGVKVSHSYAARFGSALEVISYLSDHQERLFVQTRKWVETWYDSTLPYWMLDRTMANTSTLATTTCYRHKNGRFWAWEGVGCCTGTCTHVWHYAQAPGRLFPEVERDQRERIDFGLALKEDGLIGYRALLDSSMGPAFDGQCGRILGAYREHLMTTDDKFLIRIWPKVKKALQYMIGKDVNNDGIIEGSQPNTLDADWYGKISFISSLYIAALRAGEKMALEMNDAAFAVLCADIARKGAQNMLELYNGEYFIQIEDTDHADVIGVGKGCYIDQIFGQTWSHWVGMGSIFDREKQLSALRALWKYNFVPDVGPFRKFFKAGRWYAMAGDGGLIMCSWPKGGKREKWEDQWQFMYFNECMSGFEWQAAAHMVYEGIDQPDLLQNGLAVSRAIHDRYNGLLRNPYNEIECSDHYSRAMASYGVFQAVTGFHYHGPHKHIEFAPRLTPDNFKAPFVSAEGWGTYTQKKSGDNLSCSIMVKHGQLALASLSLRALSTAQPKDIEVTINGKLIKGSSLETREGKTMVKFTEILLKEDVELKVIIDNRQ